MVCEAYFFVWIAIIVSATLHSAFIPTVFFLLFLYLIISTSCVNISMGASFIYAALAHSVNIGIAWPSFKFCTKATFFFLKKHFMSLLSFQQFVEAKMLKAIAIWKIHLNSHNLCQTIEYIVVAYTPVLFLFAFIHSQRN